MLTSSDIRRRFIDFFVRNGHSHVESSSLIPKDDPSLLFTNAGMVQFKKVFLGQEKRPYSRAVTSQKCLRVGGKHNDLENVGRTARHHTFFEMLGNFSFGDYFKEEAIRLAWAFITEEVGLPTDKLYVTIYNDDDEAADLWVKVTGIDPKRIYRLGEKDNFWSMGDTGPCGPCSEIHVDQGEDMSCGPQCGIGKCDCDRFLEIWNLVFMQYDRDEKGNLTPLPRPSIDTGMGLERITAVCQGVRSNFDGDLFQGLIGKAAQLAGVEYGKDEETNTALRVIADHSRAIAFLLADGMAPSNEGRGYVMRRLIRRAFRFGRMIGFKGPFLHKTCQDVVEAMGDVFAELKDSRDFMAKVVFEEEERFGQTLDKGLTMLEDGLADFKAKGVKRVPGDFAFKLYDTYGFPIDIVNDVAEKQGFTVDEQAFQQCMKEQRERAKKAWKGSGDSDLMGRFAALLETGARSHFVGYDKLNHEAEITALLNEQGESVKRLVQGQGGFVVAAETPFYGASGGQSGDLGRIETLTGVADVLDTLKPNPELTLHKVFMHEGELVIQQLATLAVDEDSRMAAARNHTTTHLLQAALRKILGDHVKQSGSMVTPERLRFDFTHVSALTPEELAQVEEEVNRSILADIRVGRDILPYPEAVRRGALALFGEKYADEVCMISVPGVSIELCGGTHLSATGQAGGFMILSESGVAAGVRRIEAVTGLGTMAAWQAQKGELAEALGLVKAQPGELLGKIKALQAQIKALGKDNEQLQARLVSGKGRDLMDDLEDVGGVKLLRIKLGGGNPKALRDLMDDLRSKLPSGVIFLCAEDKEEGKAVMVAAVSKDLHGKFTAPALIKEVAPLVGGSGGGRPDMAQAGGTKPEGLDEAMAKVRELVAK